MPLTPDDAQVLRAHMAKSMPGLPTCAGCGSKTWSAEGVQATVEIRDGSFALGNGVPLIMLVCDKCFHVLLFAWNPIIRAADAGKAKDG